MKIRHICAILGVAIAVGIVIFMQGLATTNDYQAVAVAERLLREVPVEKDAVVAQFALDYRPNGRVMQGPPMMVLLASTQAIPVKEGECVITKAMFAQRRLPVPPIGTELTLIGRKKTHHLKIAAVLDWEKPLRGYPNAFICAKTTSVIDEDWREWEPKTAEELSPGFTSDAARNFDRAKALLLWAAALTALCLLVNSLFLTIEARHKELAILRMIGLTRGGVVRCVAKEALILTAGGLFLGVLVALGALGVYVALDQTTYPMGLAIPVKHLTICLGLAPVVAFTAVLIALRPALRVKPLEAASNRMPRKKHFGMLIAFACGFGAFVAVEVWGASLMSAFVPSTEWPDAIVSILPGGVSAFDIKKVQSGVKGVKEIHELAPLQVNLEPLEELPSRGPSSSGPRFKAYRNALLLGSDWLPAFKFVAGEYSAAERAIREGDQCVITEMMARARNLKLGDELKLDCGRGLKMALKIAGIVDLNWHLVTSRGLVRGLNRMPVNTDGPVFVSFDTIEACDARPAPMVKMTHLWLDYEPAFLKEHGAFEAGRIVEHEIVEAFGLVTEEIEENAVRLHSRDEVADGTLAHGVEIIGSMAKVPFIFILVISLGFMAMLVASADSRKREFIVLRTIGATRGQLAKVLIGEALKVAWKGLVLGFLGGALVGWLCTAGTRAAMANWGIPPNFVVPVLTIIKGAVGAIGFALAVALPTALKLTSYGTGQGLFPKKMWFCVAILVGARFLALASVNPITPEGEFFSDPAPRVGPDGTLWLFGSRDESLRYYCSHANDLLSTQDFNLQTWKLHKDVFVSKGKGDAIPQNDDVLYAPDGIFHGGKWHIFFCMPNPQMVEGVADAESPTGPYIGARRIGKSICNQIDPSVFVDDDGKVYYTWGQFAMKMAELKSDLSDIIPETVRTNVIDEARHNFHEGSQLLKRNGIYYLVFADIGRKHTPSCIGYATAKSPFGPYTYRGVIVDNAGCDPGNWNNQGGIVEYHGKWYVFYHRATNGSTFMRKPCVEPIEFDADGFIKEVEMTSNGAGPELDPFKVTAARLACRMSGSVRIKTQKDGHERLANIKGGDTATWRYFNGYCAAPKLMLNIVSRAGGTVELADGNGIIYGSVVVPAGNGITITSMLMSLERPFPAGRAAVTLRFRGAEGVNLMDVESFQFLL